MKKDTPFTSPLNIYVVWHPAFKKGEEVAEFLYASFTRDTEAPFSRGIGIPTYFRSVPLQNRPIPKEINLNDADYNAVALLVDDEMFNDDEWNAFVKDLLLKTNNTSRIFPVAFSSNAYFLEETTLGIEQYINARPKGDSYTDIEFASVLKDIRSRILHSVCRLLLNRQPEHEVSREINTPAPIKLFISHAKKDSEKEAELFRDYIRHNTKLNTFFDANDIADGYKFDSQIKEAIQNGHAALVVFHSDMYSTREWCQIEILTAKRYKAPIVVVHNILKGEKRSFPYMGNVPTIKMSNQNFDEIIDLTLYQVLFNVFQNENLKKVKNIYLPDSKQSIELSSPPELFNFLDILSKKKKSRKRSFIVLYPDPPLGIDELKVLNDMEQEIQFMTPLQLSTLIS
jgi:hypothetical protein